MADVTVEVDMVIPLAKIPDFKSRISPSLLDEDGDTIMYSHEHAAIPIHPMVVTDAVFDADGEVVTPAVFDTVNYYGVLKCTQEFYDREIKQFEADGWVKPAGTITRHKFA